MDIRFFTIIKTVLRLVPIIWPSIFSLVFLYLFFWVLDQGHALLQDISENLVGMKSLLYFVSIFFISFYNWFYAKKAIDIKYYHENALKPNKSISLVGEFIPHYLAYVTILIGGLAIPHTGELQYFYGYSNGIISELSLLLTMAIPLLIYLGTNWSIDRYIERLIQRKEKGIYRFYVFLVLFPFTIAILPFLFSWSGTFKGHVFMTMMILSPICASIIMYSFLSGARFFIPGTSKAALTFQNLLQYLGDTSPSGVVASYVSTSSILFIVLHIAMNIYSPIAQFFSPAVVFTVCIVSLTSLFYLTMYKLKSAKYGRESIFIIFFIIVGYILFNNNNVGKYPINIITQNNSNNALSDQIGSNAEKVRNVKEEKRLNADMYTDTWLSTLSNKYPNDSTIYLVANYGGGIRAAYWTNLVLAKLMDETGGTFYDKVYAITGSSGGQLGAGLFMAHGIQTIPAGSSYIDLIQSFYEESDFLSPMISKLLGIDLLKSFIPLSIINDRQTTVEKAMELRSSKIFKRKTFEDPFLLHWSDTIHKPIFIVNSTYTQRGIRAFYSPVKLSQAHNTNGIDIIDSLRTYGESLTPKKNYAVPFSAAVMQGARFPFVSPAGSLPNDMQFVDAGYFDNLGAQSISDILDILTFSLYENEDWKCRYKIKILLINSSYEMPQSISSLAPLMAPVTTYLNTANGQTETAKKNLVNKCNDLNNRGPYDISVSEKAFSLNSLYTEGEGTNEKTYRKILPLGWYLPESDKAYMNKMVETVSLDSIDAMPEDNLYYLNQLWENIAGGVACEDKEYGFTENLSLHLDYKFKKYKYSDEDLLRIVRNLDLSNIDFQRLPSKNEFSRAISQTLEVNELDKYDTETKDYISNMIKIYSIAKVADRVNKPIIFETQGSADGEKMTWEKNYTPWVDIDRSVLKDTIKYKNNDLPKLRAKFQNYLLKEILDNNKIDYNFKTPNNEVLIQKAGNPEFRTVKTKAKI